MKEAGPDSRAIAAEIEHFPVKWIPVRVAKMRQNKNVELVSDSSGMETALVAEAERHSRSSPLKWTHAAGPFQEPIELADPHYK